MEKAESKFLVPAAHVTLAHWAMHMARVDVPVVVGGKATWECPHEDAIIMGLVCMNGKFPGAVMQMYGGDGVLAHEAPLEWLYASDQYGRITKAANDAVASMIDLLKTAPAAMWVRPSERPGGVVSKVKKMFLPSREEAKILFDQDACFPGGVVRDDSPAEAIIFAMRGALVEALDRMVDRRSDMLVKSRVERGQRVTFKISECPMATTDTAAVLVRMLVRMSAP
jgi:hypothetical protein